MPSRSVHAALNRGRVSRLALAREDIERVGISADVQTNWISRVMGSMQIRPGLGFVGQPLNRQKASFLPFIFSVTDKALLEFTTGFMRIWVNDAVLTRPVVITSTQNGQFTANILTWTNASEAGANIGWQAGTGGAGFLSLLGNGTAFAIARQNVTINAQDINVEHGLRVQVQTGPIKIRIGTAAGLDDLLPEVQIDTGGHTLTFTPTGSASWVEVKSNSARIILVDSIEIDATGPMSLPSPFLEADLGLIRGGTDSQSGDIVYLAADGYQQWAVERRGPKDWSLVLYQPEDGPFFSQNFDDSHTLTPSVLRGNGILTSSQPLFSEAHVGAIFRVQSTGQRVEATVTTDATFTNTIFLEDTGARRKFTVSRSGTWVATVTLQRSFISAAGPFEDAASYTTNGDINFDDTLDGEQTWYRIGVKAGAFTSGSIALALDYQYGTINGVGRLTNFVSETVFQMEVLSDFGRANQASSAWWEGSWSGARGFPTAVCFYEGRLCWSGRDRVWLSGSDDFYNFDDLAEGDAATISRTIGSGSVDNINWMLPLKRLILGGEGGEFSVKSSSLDEPLTPANTNLKRSSTQGSAPVQAVAVDQRGFFIQRGGTRVFDIDINEQGDYAGSHITAIIPEIGQPGVVKMAVQRQPDTRIHCVKSDGTVALAIYDKVEEVLCWSDITTQGLIEDVVVLPGNPGTDEDQVYYVVNRPPNGRILERWALESETRGGTLCKLADSFVVYTDLPVDFLGDKSVAIPLLNHLALNQVVVWANGADIGHNSDDTLIYSVTDDPAFTTPDFPSAVTNIVVGLPYQADWKSTKLTRVQLQTGTTLTLAKAVRGIGLILADVHTKGLQFGPDFTVLDRLNSVFEGRVLGPDEVLVSRDEDLGAFPAEWGSDPRVCLRAKAPRPVTVQAIVLEVEVNG